MTTRTKPKAGDPTFELPESFAGSWADAVKHGHVSETLDDEHPIATRAVGNPAPVYVSRAFTEGRLRARYRSVMGANEVIAGKMAELDAGAKVEGWTASYWLAAGAPA